MENTDGIKNQLFERRTINGMSLNNRFVRSATWEGSVGKVDYWRNSDQKHRWLGAALLDFEPRLRRVKGYRHLPQLCLAIQKDPEKQKGE